MVAEVEPEEDLDSGKKRWQKTLLIGAGIALLVLGLLSALILSPRQSSEVEIVSAPEEEKKEIAVDVAGAVQKPGLYRLTTGSRLNEALLAAGGLSAEADRDWTAKNLNLAEPLKDGSKIYVRAKTENIDQNSPSAVKTGQVNINTASLSELDSLPGIGPVIGQRIIDYRDQTGSYSNKEDLLKVSGISQKVFDKLKDQITLW